MLEMRQRYQVIYRTDFPFFQLDPEFNLNTNELQSGSNGNQFCSIAIHTKYREHSSVQSHCKKNGVKFVNHI